MLLQRDHVGRSLIFHQHRSHFVLVNSPHRHEDSPASFLEVSDAEKCSLKDFCETTKIHAKDQIYLSYSQLWVFSPGAFFQQKWSGPDKPRRGS